MHADAGKLLWDAANAAAAIPGLPRIVAFRNVLVHGYASVDNRLVWGVIEAHLAPMRAAVEKLLTR